jgi:hypothetical protein
MSQVAKCEINISSTFCFGLLIVVLLLSLGIQPLIEGCINSLSDRSQRLAQFAKGR